MKELEGEFYMSLKELNPKNRFNNRAENYGKYRPTYPREIIQYLEETIGLSKGSIIADIGSGTGILSKVFLENKNKVYAVEPNENMRLVAEKSIGEYNDFHSINGGAEDTNLKEKSVDVITVGQAFHWFETMETRKEFERILKPNGSIVILYNIPKKSDEFMSKFLNFTEKYGEKYIKESIKDSKVEFFKDEIIHKNNLINRQEVDFEGLKGLICSYSYMPSEENTKFESMMVELKELFNKYSKNDKVTLEYNTEISWCKLNK